MGERHINYKITALFNQFNNLCELLLKDHTLIKWNDLNLSYDKNFYYLSWKSNDKDTNFSVGKHLIKIDQYLEIYNKRLFHLMLNDFSLVRFNFVFEGSNLVKQNLLWWPCPIEKIELKSFEDVDLIFDSLKGIIFTSDLQMRTPIRIDYDYQKETETHPLFHMHFEHPETRIAVKKPLCIYGFMEFILKNFYSDLNIDFENWDKINLTDNKPKIQYEQILQF